MYIPNSPSVMLSTAGPLDWQEQLHYAGHHTNLDEETVFAPKSGFVGFFS